MTDALYFVIAAVCWVWFTFKIVMHDQEEFGRVNMDGYFMAAFGGFFAGLFWPLALAAYGVVTIVKRSVEAINREEEKSESV